MGVLDIEQAKRALELTETVDGLVLEGNNRKLTALLSLHGHLSDALTVILGGRKVVPLGYVQRYDIDCMVNGRLGAGQISLRRETDHIHFTMPVFSHPVTTDLSGGIVELLVRPADFDNGFDISADNGLDGDMRVRFQLARMSREQAMQLYQALGRALAGE